MDKNIVEETAGLWADVKETGIEYEKRLRKAWAKRYFIKTNKYISDEN